MNAANTFVIPWLDLIALAWFIGGWLGYLYYSKRRNTLKGEGLIPAMDKVRSRWASTMLTRENRIVDSQVINGLLRKETFFASTTLLILASTVALLGMSDQVNQLFSGIPFTQLTSIALWELKVIVLATTFVFAFFKFTWSIRQHSYCSVLLASVPAPEDITNENGKPSAKQLARLSGLAARHFNDGMRAYYFALAQLSWVFHPIAFMVATVWVIFVLYRREFHSRALEILG